MSLINPFTELKHFRARTYKTTFWSKIKDTFFVFCGRAGDNPKEIHAGIFDYVTLGVSALLSTLLLLLVPERSKNNRIQFYITFTLTLLSLLPRVLFAAAFTLSCLPFIALAHVLSMRTGQGIKESIRNCQTLKEEYELTVANSTTLQNNTVPGDSFLFEEDNDKLFYVSAAHEKKEIKVFSNFRWAVIDKNEANVTKEGQFATTLTPARSSITHEFLKNYLLNPNTPLVKSKLSVGELLKSKNLELEELDRCVFAPTIKDSEELQLSLLKERTEVRVFFSSKNTGDLTLFQNMRELNIGEIEEAIKESPNQEIIAPFLKAK